MLMCMLDLMLMLMFRLMLLFYENVDVDVVADVFVCWHSLVC